ncbi:MAG: glutathione S-transferase [Pseudomonadota bacterium]|nr:glutathione S-transferase [Pseudomonadota bacterium]
MRYELYYWSGIQGRGEFVRLALEDAGADYVNRDPVEKKSVFAPPFLRAGALLIGQTPNILHYLGPRLRLAPKAEPRRRWLHQQQLTIADWLVEVHDTHHPLASSLYYEDQKREAKRRAAIFRKERLPKFMGYFERSLRPKEPVTYVDLSLFQMIEGLRYAFPKATSRLKAKYPKLLDVHSRVAERPRIAAYLASGRRIPFNQQGIFRHYPELDG